MSTAPSPQSVGQGVANQQTLLQKIKANIAAQAKLLKEGKTSPALYSQGQQLLQEQKTMASTGRKRSFKGSTNGANQTLAQLWVQAGGPPSVANVMAAIAMAESGGDATIIQQGQPYATTGWGLWQITPGNSEPSIGTDDQLLNPLINARAAVAKYNSQGLGAWTTYTSGAYQQFLTGASSDTATSSGYSLTRPGGQSTASGGTDVDAAFTAYYEQQGQVPPVSGGGVSTDADILGIQVPGLSSFPGISAAGALIGGINDTTSFFHYIGWILNPYNLLRMVEFLIGIALMAFGAQAIIQGRSEVAEGFQTGEAAISRSGLGRVSRELASGGNRKSIATAPHATRRTALRVRYEREQQVSRRNTTQRRSAAKGNSSS